MWFLPSLKFVTLCNYPLHLCLFYISDLFLLAFLDCKFHEKKVIDTYLCINLSTVGIQQTLALLSISCLEDKNLVLNSPKALLLIYTLYT
jgi:hypothetical protein